MGLFLITLFLRLLNWRMVVYGDEAWHFFAARYFEEPQGVIVGLGASESERLGRLVWWRPLFVLGLAPGAALSFRAWRLEEILLTSALVPLAYLIVRAAGGGRAPAAGAAAAVLLHPVLHRWSVVGFADALMTTAFAFGLWQWLRGRTLWSAAGFLAAVWVKESALVAVAYMAAWDLLRRLRRRELPSRSLAAWARAAPLPLVIPIGLYPLWHYLELGGQIPGWALGGDPGAAWDLVLLRWLLVPIVIGLAWGRTRPLCGHALAIPGFYYAYAKWGHHFVEPWYAVLPGFVALIASAFVCGEALRRATSWPSAGRAATKTGVTVLSILLAIQVIVPENVPGKSIVVGASFQAPGRSLPQVIAGENSRDRAFPEMISRFEAQEHGAVFLVDFAWFFRYHPFSELSERVRWGYTNGAGDRAPWQEAIEREADATILYKWFGPGHGPYFEEIRSAYAPCIEFENKDYVLIRGQRCVGAWD